MDLIIKTVQLSFSVLIDNRDRSIPWQKSLPRRAFFSHRNIYISVLVEKQTKGRKKYRLYSISRPKYNGGEIPLWIEKQKGFLSQNEARKKKLFPLFLCIFFFLINVYYTIIIIIIIVLISLLPCESPSLLLFFIHHVMISSELFFDLKWLIKRKRFDWFFSIFYILKIHTTLINRGGQQPHNGFTRGGRGGKGIGGRKAKIIRII